MLEQFMIAINGLIAIALTQLPVPKSWIKFAPVFGLIGQPFWLISTYQNQQFGIFTVCCCYLGLWSIGIYRSWLANDKEGWKEFKANFQKTAKQEVKA